MALRTAATRCCVRSTATRSFASAAKGAAAAGEEVTNSRQDDQIA